MLLNFASTHPKSGLSTPGARAIPVNYAAVIFFAGWATGSVQASILLSGLALLEEPMRYRDSSR